MGAHFVASVAGTENPIVAPGATHLPDSTQHGDRTTAHARRFLPRDAKHPRYYVCLSVRLSVTSRCSVETTERIELFLACELSSTRPTLC